MELRLLAEFSKDPVWIGVFNNNEDLHTKLCMSTFDIDSTLVKTPFPKKPDWTYRDIQKTLNFGLAYGMSKFKLSNTIQISVDEAETIIKKFFAACPAVEKFLDGIAEKGARRGYIKSSPPFSRVRYFDKEPSPAMIQESYGNRAKAFERRRGEIERASRNHPLQASNSDIIKLALVNAQNFIDAHQLDVKIMLSVYDEIQTDCEESIAPQWAIDLERIMVESAQVVIKSVPVVVDVKINDAWSK